MTNVATFAISAVPEELVAFIKTQRDRGAFGEIHSVDIRENTVTAKMDTPDLYYRTRYYLSPQANGSTRLEIANLDLEPDEEKPFLIWSKLRRELSRSGYLVESVSGEGSTIGSFGHPYVDPATITNRGHKVAIEVTIQEFLASEREKRRPKSAKKLAAEIGYSETRYSEIKRLYLKSDESDDS